MTRYREQLSIKQYNYYFVNKKEGTLSQERPLLGSTGELVEPVVASTERVVDDHVDATYVEDPVVAVWGQSARRAHQADDLVVRAHHDGLLDILSVGRDFDRCHADRADKHCQGKCLFHD